MSDGPVVADLFEQLFGKDADAWRRHLAKPFEPYTSHYSEMDYLLYLEADISYTVQWLPGTNIELLWHPYEKRLVGVKINCFSHVAPPEVVAAYREAHERKMREIRESK